MADPANATAIAAASRFEVPAVQAAHSIQELQIEKRHWNHEFASAHDFPKFVKGGR
jgi:hypothetical protein